MCSPVGEKSATEPRPGVRSSVSPRLASLPPYWLLPITLMK